MLEVKLLKVTHSGKKEAKKVLPYLDNADIFGLEVSNLTEEEASLKEANFEKVLTTGVSKDKFFRSLKANLERSGMHSGMRKYQTTIYGGVFMKKLPLWHLERFGVRRRDELMSSRGEYLDKMELCYELTTRGDEDNFLKVYWEGLNMNKQMSIERDKEIARNIDQAEERIRSRYNNLRDKESVRMVAMVGSEHFPEKFTNHPVEIVNLVSKEITPMTRLYSTLRSGMSFEESRQILLEARDYELAEMENN